MDQQIINVEYDRLKISVFINDIHEFGQTINVRIIIDNEFPYAVRVKPPTILNYYGYSENDPENKISGNITLRWVDDELVMEKDSWERLTTISFQPENIGKYIIEISGVPKLSTMIYPSDEVIYQYNIEKIAELGLTDAWVDVNYFDNDSVVARTFLDIDNESVLFEEITYVRDEGFWRLKRWSRKKCSSPCRNLEITDYSFKISSGGRSGEDKVDYLSMIYPDVFNPSNKTGIVGKVRVKLSNSESSFSLEYTTVRMFSPSNGIIPPNSTCKIHEALRSFGWETEGGDDPSGLPISRLKGRTYLIEIQLLDAFNKIIGSESFIHKF